MVASTNHVSSDVTIHDNCNQNKQKSAYPRAILQRQENSLLFQDREFLLMKPVKIGRSVARARPETGNAIFDCKVLSRDHAILWHEDGKFYLKDTLSSNGTFVNNERLIYSTEVDVKSREVFSGDILQFGVDVLENHRQVTHGCIIATLRLFFADGVEACSKSNNSKSLTTSTESVIPDHDLYQLNQYIQESLSREQLLETKIAVLERLVSETQGATSLAWKALIDEDRLLTQVEILECQLNSFRSSCGEDKLRENLNQLIADKWSYQEAAKSTLKKLVDEKLQAISKVEALEKALSNSEDEFATLEVLYKRSSMETERLTAEMDTLKYVLSMPDVGGGGSSNDVDRLNNISNVMVNGINGGDSQVVEESPKCIEEDSSNFFERYLPPSPLSEENAPKIDLCNELENSDACLVSELKQSLAEAESKIERLILVKQRLADLSDTNTNLEFEMSDMEQELSLLWWQTRILTAFSMFPLCILVIAIVLAFMPFLNLFLGTWENI